MNILIIIAISVIILMLIGKFSIIKMAGYLFRGIFKVIIIAIIFFIIKYHWQDILTLFFNGLNLLKEHGLVNSQNFIN